MQIDQVLTANRDDSFTIGNTTIRRVRCCSAIDGSSVENQPANFDNEDGNVEYLNLSDEEWEAKVIEASGIQEGQSLLKKSVIRNLSIIHQSKSDSDPSTTAASDHTHENSLYELFPCDLCGSNFITENDRDDHLLVHQITTEIHIEKPNYSNSAKKHIRKSEVTIRVRSNNLCPCRICGKSFRYKSLLELHMQIHREDSFVCDICGRGTKTKGLLKRHLMSHTDEKRFECDVCGEKTKHKSGLTAHMRKHTAERPYSCEICFRSFAHCTDLRRHRASHGIFKKRFSCTECPKVFCEKKFLRRHMGTHENSKRKAVHQLKSSQRGENS